MEIVVCCDYCVIVKRQQLSSLINSMTPLQNAKQKADLDGCADQRLLSSSLNRLSKSVSVDCDDTRVRQSVPVEQRLGEDFEMVLHQSCWTSIQAVRASFVKNLKPNIVVSHFSPLLLVSIRGAELDLAVE